MPPVMNRREAIEMAFAVARCEAILGCRIDQARPTLEPLVASLSRLPWKVRLSGLVRICEGLVREHQQDQRVSGRDDLRVRQPDWQSKPTEPSSC